MKKMLPTRAVQAGHQANEAGFTCIDARSTAKPRLATLRLQRSEDVPFGKFRGEEELPKGTFRATGID